MISKGKCEIFVDRIDEVLIFIVDVEVIRKVINVCFCCSGCRICISKYVLSKSWRNGYILSRGLCCMIGFFLGFYDFEIWIWLCRLLML